MGALWGVNRYQATYPQEAPRDSAALNHAQSQTPFPSFLLLSTLPHTNISSLLLPLLTLSSAMEIASNMVPYLWSHSTSLKDFFFFLRQIVSLIPSPKTKSKEILFPSHWGKGLKILPEPAIPCMNHSQLWWFGNLSQLVALFWEGLDIFRR